jgi:glutamine synthetase
LHGLDTKGDPGPPIVGNAYEQTEARTLFWRDTINDFIASDFIKTTFGAEFQHVFGTLKQKEMRSFYTEVTTLEYQWYLRQV